MKYDLTQSQIYVIVTLLRDEIENVYGGTENDIVNDYLARLRDLVDIFEENENA